MASNFFQYDQSLTLILIALMLIGCSTKFQSIPESSHPERSWQTYKADLKKLNKWQVTGRIGIRLRNQGESANYTWKQNEKKYTLQLYGPFGIGEVLLKGKLNHYVTLKDADGHIHHSQTPEQLMQKLFNWYVPVSQLKYWGLGLPAPGAIDKLKLNEKGLIKKLKQKGWQIHYKQYEMVNGLPLPGKIEMKRANLHITALLKSWTIH